MQKSGKNAPSKIAYILPKTPPQKPPIFYPKSPFKKGCILSKKRPPKTGEKMWYNRLQKTTKISSKLPSKTILKRRKNHLQNCLWKLRRKSHKKHVNASRKATWKPVEIRAKIAHTNQHIYRKNRRETSPTVCAQEKQRRKRNIALTAKVHHKKLLPLISRKSFANVYFSPPTRSTRRNSP